MLEMHDLMSYDDGIFLSNKCITNDMRVIFQEKKGWQYFRKNLKNITLQISVDIYLRVDFGAWRKQLPEDCIISSLNESKLFC